MPRERANKGRAGGHEPIRGVREKEKIESILNGGWQKEKDRKS